MQHKIGPCARARGESIAIAQRRVRSVLLGRKPMMPNVWRIAYDGTAGRQVYARASRDEVGAEELGLRDTLADEVRTPRRCGRIDVGAMDELSGIGGT